MPFPTPTANQTRDMFEIFKFINNDASGGIFFPIMLLVIWVIGFVGAIAEGREPHRAWIFSFFIISILGIILSLMDFLYFYFSILMLAIGVFWANLKKSKGL
ncbi:MAG: hypothetical protein ACTSQA_04445 [Candidatus Heimdallarchaeaceae archaeon]